MIKYILHNSGKLANAVAALNCIKRNFTFLEISYPCGSPEIVIRVYEMQKLEEFKRTNEGKLLLFYGELGDFS